MRIGSSSMWGVSENLILCVLWMMFEGGESIPDKSTSELQKRSQQG